MSKREKLYHRLYVLWILIEHYQQLRAEEERELAYMEYAKEIEDRIIDEYLMDRYGVTFDEATTEQQQEACRVAWVPKSDVEETVEEVIRRLRIRIENLHRARYETVMELQRLDGLDRLKSAIRNHPVELHGVRR